MSDNQCSDSENDEMMDLQDELSHQQSDKNQSMKSKSSNRSRRQPMPIQWTRVISLDTDQIDDIHAFELSADHENLEESFEPISKKSKKQWQPLFYSKDFWKQHDDKQLKTYFIGKRPMKSLAKQAVNARQMFFERAQTVEKSNMQIVQDGLQHSVSHGKTIRKRGMNNQSPQNQISKWEYQNPVPVDHRRRSRAKRNVTVSEKIDIVDQVLCKLKTYAVVAKEHRTTVSCICKIIKQSKRNPKFLKELVLNSEAKEEQNQTICKLITEMFHKNVFMNSVKSINAKLLQQNNIEIKDSKLSNLMHKNLRMKYRAIKPITFTANNNMNLILRQQFARTFLNLDLEKKVIINIDESWINQTDFRYMKWALPRSTNSVAMRQVQPRLSLIAALDTNGSVFFTLSQANSNSDNMKIFFEYLIIRLDKERKGWRKHTIFLIDNAPYHKSESLMTYFKDMQLPIMFTGPHSYDAVPIELLFSAIKAAQLNPEDEKTSKSKL